MIAKTDFKYGGAGDLVKYISRDDDRQVPVKDHAGRKLDQKELEEFVEKSKQYGVERHMIVAPDPDAAYSRDEVDRRIRKTMNEWQGGREGSQYVYAVHESNQIPHAHVAMTGREDALHMDKEDVVEFRETAREAFQERERIPHRKKSPEARASQSSTLTPEKAESEAEAEIEAEPDPDDDPDPEQGHNNPSRRGKAKGVLKTLGAQKAVDLATGGGDDGGEGEASDQAASSGDADPGGPEGITPGQLLKIAARGTVHGGQTDDEKREREDEPEPDAEEASQEETASAERDSLAEAEPDYTYSE